MPGWLLFLSLALLVGPGRYGKLPQPAPAENLDRRVVLLTFWDDAPDPAWAELRNSNPNDLRVLGFENSTGSAFLSQLASQVGPLRPLPLTLLVNRQGDIIYRHSGPLDEAFRKALRDELSSR